MFAPLVKAPKAKTVSNVVRPSTNKTPQLMTWRRGLGAAEQVLMPQRTIGNQATRRLLSQRASTLTGNEPGKHYEQEVDPTAMTTREAAPGISWDFSKIPVSSPDWLTRPQAPSLRSVWPLPSVTQPKLAVGRVDDPLEHEADHVADQVMRMPNPERSIKVAPSQLSRKCAACEEEAQTLQTKPVGSTKVIDSEVPDIVHEVLRSPGQPLDAPARAFFEPRFGHDFRQVRIHADMRAARSARAMNAQAYTVGHDVVFGADRYTPHTRDGGRLLAHELTHVVQQTGIGAFSPTISRSSLDAPSMFGMPVTLLQRRPDVSGTNYAFDTFQVTEAQLSDPDIIARFEALSKDQLIDYRNRVFDLAVQAYIDGLLANLAVPSVPCTAQESSDTSRMAEQARKDTLPWVKLARLALDRLQNQWISNKADILAGRLTLQGDVACAYNSNFNISPLDPDYVVRMIGVSRRLRDLEILMGKPVPYACQPSGDSVCASNEGRDTIAYVVNHQPPIHFCQGFSTNPDTLDQQATIAHEFTHLLTFIDDAGGYAFGGLGAQTTTCDLGAKFNAKSDILMNTADALAGFVMHIGQVGATDIRVR